jgi:hypothetical protein
VKDDIVACVLLLYNPVVSGICFPAKGHVYTKYILHSKTRCPLHVHAYRLDSELTAHNLNEQLQILIGKPENQKRFAELEQK